MQSLFIELLQVSLGSRDQLSRVPTTREWEDIYDEADRQAVLGIMLEGLQRCMVHDERFMANLPIDLKLEWIGDIQMIEEQNRLMSKACEEIIEQLENDGFQCCVLKGQANHRYYPEAMRMRRSAGDIDIWVVPMEEGICKKGNVRRVLEYVEKKQELTGLCWLHCNYDHGEGIPVEIHFRPSFMNEPCKNKRFQKYFADIKRFVTREKVDGVELPVMKVEEDVIYQMNHIYRHLIDEGVGMRQIVDYYFLLCKLNGERIANSETIIHHTSAIIHQLRMNKFAAALMYVMKEICGLDQHYLLCEPNEKEGKFLLNEILTAGNFGQSDPRMSEINHTNVPQRQISQAWRRYKRNMRFLTSYPGEVIWEPVARVNHFAWKKLKLWRV